MRSTSRISAAARWGGFFGEFAGELALEHDDAQGVAEQVVQVTGNALTLGVGGQLFLFQLHLGQPAPGPQAAVGGVVGIGRHQNEQDKDEVALRPLRQREEPAHHQKGVDGRAAQGHPLPPLPADEAAAVDQETQGARPIQPVSQRPHQEG